MLDAAVDPLAGEVAAPRPGTGAVVDPLVDALLVYLLRAWLAERSAQCPDWFVALADPRSDGPWH